MLKRFKKLKKNKKGFSLVEVVTAMAIFVITCTMLLGSVYTATKIAALAKAKTSSTIFASSALEKMVGSGGIGGNVETPVDGSTNTLDTGTNDIKVTFRVR